MKDTWKKIGKVAFDTEQIAALEFVEPQFVEEERRSLVIHLRGNAKITIIGKAAEEFWNEFTGEDSSEGNPNT